MNIIIIDKNNQQRANLENYIRSNTFLCITELFDNIKAANNYLRKRDKFIELVIINLELPDLDIVALHDLLPKNCNIIGICERKKTLDKYINISYIQRVFVNPVSLSTLINYINIQNNLETLETARKNKLRMLYDIGFNINHSGTQYLVEAILFSMRNNVKKLSDIYTLVAYNHNIDPRIIGWSINNAINKTLKTADILVLQEFFKVKDSTKLSAKYIVNFLITCTSEK